MSLTWMCLSPPPSSLKKAGKCPWVRINQKNTDVCPPGASVRLEAVSSGKPRPLRRCCPTCSPRWHPRPRLPPAGGAAPTRPAPAAWPPPASLPAPRWRLGLHVKGTFLELLSCVRCPDRGRGQQFRVLLGPRWVLCNLPVEPLGFLSCPRFSLMGAGSGCASTPSDSSPAPARGPIGAGVMK